MLWLSWPERGWTPLIFLSFIPLLFVEDWYFKNYVKRSSLKFFGHLFCSMLLWNVLSTWWVYNSTAVGSFLAFGFNSLFMALVLLLFHLTKKKLGIIVGYFSLIIYWIAFEYLHLHWDLSWPWLTLGNVFAMRPEYVQWYEFTGVLGGTLWVLIANLFFFAVARNIFNRDLLSQLRRINSAIALTACAILIITPMIFSLWLYKRHVRIGNPVKIAVVQPNIDPYNEKFNGTGDEQLARMLQLASTVIDSTTDFAVFPETALPDGIWEENLAQHPQIVTLKRFIHAFPNITVVIGASTFKAYPDSTKISETARKLSGSNNYFDVFNTALMIDRNDSIQIYHKTRLVPGVEKMPYPKIFGFLEKYAISIGGTSGSLGIQNDRTIFMTPNKTPVAPAVCYESIYGDYLSNDIREGAQIIFIITNDGWWGNTPGYRQHMNYARLRAIEFRKSIARSANTGISCFINQRGDILKKTDWWKPDAISEVLLKNKIKTFYARHGDYLGVIASYCAVILLIILPIQIIRKKRQAI